MRRGVNKGEELAVDGEREDVGRFYMEGNYFWVFYLFFVSVNQIARLVDNGLQM